MFQFMESDDPRHKRVICKKGVRNKKYGTNEWIFQRFGLYETGPHYTITNATTWTYKILKYSVFNKRGELHWFTPAQFRERFRFF